jgi:hypothetical protein
MPYQLGQYVRQHNRNQRTAGTRQLAALGIGAARAAYNALPTFPVRSEQKLVSQVLKQTHEPRNIDISVTGLSFSTTAYNPLLLNPLAQGTGGQNRVGRRVKMESLRLRIQTTLGYTHGSDTYRFLVFLDNESRGAAAGTIDLLTVNTFGDAQIMSSLNFDNVQRRFRILVDEVVSVNASAWDGTHFGPIERQFKWDLSLNAIVHYYNTTAGNISDIDSGSLYLFVIGNQSVNPSSYAVDSRIVFRDM